MKHSKDALKSDFWDAIASTCTKWSRENQYIMFPLQGSLPTCSLVPEVLKSMALILRQVVEMISA